MEPTVQERLLKIKRDIEDIRFELRKMLNDDTKQLYATAEVVLKTLWTIAEKMAGWQEQEKPPVWK